MTYGKGLHPELSLSANRDVYPLERWDSISEDSWVMFDSQDNVARGPLGRLLSVD